MTTNDTRLTRIGVFYDGNFFFHVSNYYQYHHERRARISVGGLHDFIRQQVADSEGTNVRYCQIVDAHYFRGRLRAHEAEERGTLLGERKFDDVLIREGVVTHFLQNRADGEMGIDVWLALEAYELAIHKRFDVSVLVTCDGDFLPLVRKLNTLGTRVMLLGWDFTYVAHNGEERTTRTSQVLLDEVTYPIMMHQVIDDRSRRGDQFVNNLFLQQRAPRATNGASGPSRASQPDLGSQQTAAPTANGTVKLIKEGYGFIVPESGGKDVFFYHSDLQNADFNDLKGGEKVSFEMGTNDKGPCARRITVAST